MKDPSDVHHETGRWEWEGSDSLCAGCLNRWPCPKIEKWWASASYRIQKLEETVKSQSSSIQVLREQLSAARETGHRNDITIRGILIPFVNDLANGVTDGVATFSVTTDHEDFTPLGGARLRVAGRREWHAKYESSRVVVENGEVTETRVPR